MQNLPMQPPPTTATINKNGQNGHQNGYQNGHQNGHQKKDYQEDYDVAAQLSHQILSCATKLQAMAHILDEVNDTGEPIPPAALETLPMLVMELKGIGLGLGNLTAPSQSESAADSYTVDIISLVEEVVQPFLMQAEGQVIKREYQSYPLMVRGEADKIRIVLDNLLSNAVKYSKGGRPIIIQVEMHPLLSEANDKQLLVSVTNFGSFIPADERQKIFTKTYRRDGHSQPGQGLGLYIARCLVERQGGRLDVDSQLHNGTTFWFTLPLVES